MAVLNRCLNVDKNHPEYRYLSVLLTSSLVLSLTITGFFFYNIYLGARADLIVVEGIFALISYLCLYVMLVQKKTKAASWILLSYVMTLAFIVMTMINMRSFTLMWLLICPVLSIYLCGFVLGSLFNLVYFIAFSVLCYFQMSSWQAEPFTIVTYIQLSMLYFVIFAITAAYESGRKRAYRRLTDSNERLTELAYHDTLTGLGNRRYLEDTLIKSHKIQYVALIDIDNFKDVNDQFGHDQGDLVLQSVAQCMEHVADSCDAEIVRWGGEEFTLTFDMDDKKAFEQTLEAIREAVENGDHIADTKVTVSIGGAKLSNDYKRALREADEALYRAKSEGKNRYILA